ncbi:hypothetical protein HPB48_009944 [Haemaphysalis longicornis]|uniref:Uncharacterized protein n=1 Tax=Haemaphysalis longicornis TaxID=44386 RepID=A0A9J6GMI0_HAELO|nr:hypothetical protein HPB48_009944 [Haemaphysalis longicornis]
MQPTLKDETLDLASLRSGLNVLNAAKLFPDSCTRRGSCYVGGAKRTEPRKWRRSNSSCKCAFPRGHGTPRNDEEEPLFFNHCTVSKVVPLKEFVIFWEPRVPARLTGATKDIEYQGKTTDDGKISNIASIRTLDPQVAEQVTIALALLDGRRTEIYSDFKTAVRAFQNGRIAEQAARLLSVWSPDALTHNSIHWFAVHVGPVAGAPPN